MSLAAFDCHACGSHELEEITEFRALPRVTSDCKPFAPGGRLAVCRACGATQKPADAQWRKDCDGIYATYEPYYQSGGVEQAVYDPLTGAPRRRSQVIVDRLSAERGLGAAGKVLDVGCGNGVLLTAFGAAKPGWRLFGHELSELNLPFLQKIPGFEKLFTGSLDGLEGEFDIITLMHSLEHFSDPLSGLVALKKHIGETGAIFVEVPNGAATPFDLLVADHASHFTLHDLARLARRAGLGAPVISDSWVTKELSFLATQSGPVAALPPDGGPAAAFARVRAQVRWLEATVARADEASASGKPFGIFGTSVAAMWLFGQFGDRTAFFVDEDPGRKNATLFGRPIYAPQDAPAGATVYVALIPEVAARVAARIGRSDLTLITPPAVGAYAV